MTKQGTLTENCYLGRHDGKFGRIVSERFGTSSETCVCTLPEIQLLPLVHLKLIDVRNKELFQTIKRI